MAKEKQKTINIKNRKAEFDYYLMEKYTAGLVLTGTEIKSIRLGKVWVKNMNIAQYFYGTYNHHAARRDRKLLLNRREITRLQNATKSPGFTIVPTLLFIDENGRAKLDIHLARGKHTYDKRETLKEKEDRRAIDRQFKHNY